jgi:hypothetical protein
MRSWSVLGLCALLLMTSLASAQKPWTVSRTADGHPDLQGTWENNSATPLERPAAFANKPMLTDADQWRSFAAARLFAPYRMLGDGFTPPW